MKSSTLTLQFCLLNHIDHTNSPLNPSLAVPRKTTSPKLLLQQASSNVHSRVKTIPVQNSKSTAKKVSLSILGTLPRFQNHSKLKILEVSPNGHSRFVVIGAVAVGFVLLAFGMDDQKALAFGPEGPLVEEFWDNVRRYGLYALTVSTGAIYTLLVPIIELLKNPISAILLVIILGGSFYLLTQVLSAMVGVTDFTYNLDYINTFLPNMLPLSR